MHANLADLMAQFPASTQAAMRQAADEAPALPEESRRVLAAVFAGAGEHLAAMTTEEAA